MSGEMIYLCLSFLSIHYSWTSKRKCLRLEKLTIPHYKIRESKAVREREREDLQEHAGNQRVMEKRVKAVFVFFVTNKRQFQCLDLYVKGYCTFSQSLMVLNGRNCMYQIWKGATEIILRQRVEKFKEKVCPVLEFLVIIMLFTKQKPWWRSWFLAENAPFFGIWHWYIDSLGHLHAVKSTLTSQKEEKIK